MDVELLDSDDEIALIAAAVIASSNTFNAIMVDEVFNDGMLDAEKSPGFAQTFRDDSEFKKFIRLKAMENERFVIVDAFRYYTCAYFMVYTPNNVFRFFGFAVTSSRYCT